LDLLPANPRVIISIFFAWDGGLVVHPGFQGVCMYPVSRFSIIEGGTSFAFFHHQL
jgi:hypothetical protein